MFEDTYITVGTAGKGSFRDRASKFIAHAIHVENESDVKEQLAIFRKQYHDANHHCYAWQLEFDSSVYRINDDGEPSGSAGRPIYGQIQTRGLTMVLVVVIRYFGGTKLGVSGLINAYKTAASLALEDAVLIEKTVNEVYKAEFTYESMNDVMKLLKDEKLIQGKHCFEMECSLEFTVRKRDADRVLKLFEDLRKVKISWLRTH